ncbi:NADP-dependent oxidoreductase [Desulfosarcina sp.]|uniref:NADP-dependent oxidoreductase n=1 Tax=Desulfosarcina sp. TaxID=2027861 RepID=UPI0029B37F7E|nr:NADP-dependent oxidoreductase [Desulfosarcina sp.]MDX2453289.1 NADP-dependent oxidoreductase [Desulfosarcina sp.]MDX2491012.1 NADP-dependent oxidoreductase [Desulfosarcina sp.]
MSQSKEHNRCIVLAKRPQGAPVPENFRMEKTPVPEPAEGQVLLRTEYLSLDPYMRGRMSDAPSYAEPVKVGEVMVGGTVGRIEASRHPDYKAGEWVLGYCGWQDYALSDGTGLTRLGQNPQNASYALGILGMPGFTAYMGLLDIGRPKQGETLVVAAATGPVGATVGQIGKLKGCRVVGVAGSSEKCDYAKAVLGLDACLDHQSSDFAQQLGKACAKGIDIYFESVGGKVFDAALPLLNTKARIPVCGLISHYNATQLPDGPDRLSLLMRTILAKRLKVQGFIIFEDYGHRYDEFSKDMSQWLSTGQIKYREHMVDGLEHAPNAFIGMLVGQNFGKLVVRVNDEH